VETVIESGGLRLAAHRAGPTRSGGPVLGLVLCHGFPAGPRGGATSGQTYPELADRLASETGWVVLTFNFRGTGLSEVEFSLSGWLDDLRAAAQHVLDVEGVGGVWLAGSSTGGSLAICVAGDDERVRGVAALAAPAEFDAWASDPARFLEHARQLGVVRDPSFPPDFDTWARELTETRAIALVGKIPPRALLLVHGSDDDVVPAEDARVLADAAGGSVDLRILSGAGHRLRHDPRAVAVLIGWMERQTL